MKDSRSSQTALRTAAANQAAALPAKGAAGEIYRPPSSDALLREASMSPRPAVLTGLGIIAVFLGCLALWLVYIPLRADIHVPGEVVFKTKRQTVQHLEGGIVKRILVRDGDVVQAGQPLIMLENSQVQPLVNMLDEQNIAEIAYLARVESESKDLASIRFPRSITMHANDPAIAKIIQTEERLFSARRAAFQNQVQLLRSQIAQLRESSKGTQERLIVKKQEIDLVKEELETNQALQKQGYVTHTVVMDLQRTLAAHTGEYDLIAASVASDKHRMVEFEQRILALKADRVQGAVNDMKQSSLRRIDQQERVRPLRDTLERQIIRAPIAGKVVGLKVTTIGGVIMPRETLLEIAPIGDHVILEARIRLEDISEVKVGQKADVVISGVHLLARPDVKARVKYISDDRIAVVGQQPYYAATLDFDQNSLKTLGDTTLRPGMSAQINIATKPRTPVSDLIESLHEHFAKSRVTR
jgi:HlyD family type I secretion membrane fusion protein